MVKWFLMFFQLIPKYFDKSESNRFVPCVFCFPLGFFNVLFCSDVKLTFNRFTHVFISQKK